MINVLKKLFGLPDSKQVGPISLPGNRSFQASVQDGAESAIRGQLVQMMMRDVQRKSGIPPGWIECQIQVVASRSRGPGIYVRLVVKHWDSRLMRYTFAFQKALLTAIVQFEPNATDWLHGISWQLEVAGTCPLTELPGSDFWKTHGVVDPFEIIPMPVPVPAPVLPAFVAASILPAVAAVSATSFSLDELAPLPAFVEAPVTPENDTAEDLERLFAIRDRELEHLAINNLLPVGYEKTEPSPL